jgi:hypothetical protein
MRRKRGEFGVPVRATTVRVPPVLASSVRASSVRASSVLAVLILVAACGSQAVTTTTAARTAGASCPAVPTHFQLPAVGSARARLIPAGPVTAAFCQYRHGKATGLPRRVLLTGVAAAGLAAVIDSAGPVQPPARRCAGPTHLYSYAQEIIFTYPGGRIRSAAVASTDCQLGLVAAGGRAGELPFQVAADLFYYTSITTLPDGSAPAPDLIGLTTRAAVSRARRDHYSVGIDGAVLDAAAAPGTVVFQSLPAGARNSGPGGSVTVLLAARPAAQCTPSQLGLTYLAGGESAGNDFGTLLVRDVSARPCTLAGPLRVTGLGPGGQPDTTTRVDDVQGSAVLTAEAGPIRWRPPGVLAGTRPGELTGSVSLISEYRDGPAGVDRGLCEPLWVVPASWRVTLPGGVLTVPNAAAANPGGIVSSGGFVTCRGRLGVAAPATVSSP